MAVPTLKPQSPFRSPASYLTGSTPSPPRSDTFAARAELPSSDATRVGALAPPETQSGTSSGTRNTALAAATERYAVAVRVLAAALCMISFSVMAADKNKGWTLDSFDRYAEYRYCLSVNVIGFVYAGVQAASETFKRRKNGFYVDFAIDQVLTYLLISSSSSASSRTNYWVTNWGNDPFPKMITASVVTSFLAFIAFAFSSLVSAYRLFSSRTY